MKEEQRYLYGNEFTSASHIRVAFKPSKTLMCKVKGQKDKTEECKVVEEYDEEEEEWYYGKDYNEQRKKKCEKKSR